MFKIEFDPHLGAFVIEIMKWGMFWRRIRTQGDAPKAVMCFDTYDEAWAFVERTGLNVLYKDKSANRYREYISQAGAYEIPMQRPLMG